MKKFVIGLIVFILGITLYYFKPYFGYRVASSFIVEKINKKTTLEPMYAIIVKTDVYKNFTKVKSIGSTAGFFKENQVDSISTLYQSYIKDWEAVGDSLIKTLK